MDHFNIAWLFQKLENDVSTLKEQLQTLMTELDLVEDSNDELDRIVEELQRTNANFEALYNSNFIGCWYTLNSALQGAPTEIQIYPGGVGSLDFGAAPTKFFLGVKSTESPPYIWRHSLLQLFWCRL